MTGQVKEEVLTRFGELGVRVVDGRVGLEPGLLPLEDLMPLHAGEAVASFSFCAVPMSIGRGEVASVEIVRRDGTAETVDGAWLSAEDSAAIFGRSGAIERVRWSIAAS